MLLTPLASVPTSERFISSITLGELLYGALRLGSQGSALLRQLERLLVSDLAVLPFDEAAARRYGEVRALLERRGTPIGDGDTRIASIALVHGFTVVTGNVRHFSRVPSLRVENWLR